jgi:peptidoglycan/LPS O-acetylase OafA/YrhL
MPTTDSRLPLLDYCRFVAALSVLSFHYFWNGIANGKLTSLEHVDALTVWARFGYLGVDLFFMISGYVIFMSARRRTTAQFIVGRATRLYPAYLVAMLVTSAFAVWLGAGGTAVTARQVLGNVLFYQPLHRQHFVDGVYWTLMVEIKFYVAVAVLIAAGAQRHFELIFRLWPLAMLLAFVFGAGDLGDPNRGNWAIFGGYFPFFAMGALFAILRERKSAWTYACLLVSAGLGLRYALALVARDSTTGELLTTGVLICAFAALFFVINWSADGRLPKLPGAALLGALTYPLYLVHAHIGYMLLYRFGSNEHRFASYTLTIAFVFLLAWLLHDLVEVRGAGFWRSLFESAVDIAQRPFRYVARRRADWRRRQA